MTPRHAKECVWIRGVEAWQADSKASQFLVGLLEKERITFSLFCAFFLQFPVSSEFGVMSLCAIATGTDDLIPPPSPL